MYFEGIIENITESKNYNLYLEKNLKLHELVAEIATEFINITPEKTDTLIEKTLAKLGLFANAEYSILYLLNEQLISSKAVYEWLENPEELWFQEIKTASLSMFPTYEEKLKFGETVIINSIDEIDASETEKQLLLQKGFKAFIIAPIIVNNELSGILGLIGIKEPKLQWSINDKQILQLVAPILLSALQHKKEQLARIESEQRFKSVFDNTGDAMILLGETIEDCNQAALELFQCQREDIIGKTPFDFSPEIQPDGQKSIDKGLMLIELAKQNQASPFYWQHTTLSGQPIDTEVSLSKINYQEKELLHASIRDITLKKQEENNRILIAKLQSLGTLAGGLAHDFNNLLTAIFGNIQLALLENDIEKIKKYLAINDPILERAKGLTQQLLTFSKGGEPKREVVSVKEVIEKNVKFFLSGSRVGLEIDIPDNLWYSYIDKDQIGQVLQNLISNAREAMNDVGTIIITAENYIEKDHKYVRIRLSDTGPGIPPDIMLRIFDPYFTTKPTGTGLGLSISRSIITRHDGQISVESLPNKGTTFTITLPATEPVGSAEHSKTKNLPQLTKKYLKLLILDDEQIILTLLTRMLEKLGHQVTSTTDGRQTIEIYRQAWEAGSPFDIVILDITVPGGLGGKETIQELLKIDPNVKAIVSSGYSDDPVIAKYQEYGFKAALSKPYRLNELNQIINSLI